MSIERETKFKGKNVFFTLGSKTDAEKLKESLDQLGLGGFAPDNNTRLSALKQALHGVCANRRRLVRPLPGESGYAVVSESRDENGVSLDHSVDFDALLPSGSGDPVYRNPETGLPCNPPEEVRILHRYQIELKRLPSNKVSIALVRVLDHMHAVSLRPTGGIYWLPQGAVSKFQEAAKAFEEASEDSSNIIYFQTTAMDDDLRRTVVDSLKRSISNEVSTMEEDVMTGDLGKRAIKTKKERCAKLRARVIGYQKMFSVTLKELEDHLDTVESAEAMNAFASFGV